MKWFSTMLVLFLFATKLAGPRINACFEYPSHGLFLTYCTEEKNLNSTQDSIFTIQHIQYNVQQYMCGYK
jgi:hypothetical protein